MACSNCNTQNCGCASGTYVVSATCPPACSEVFNTACIVYTGVDITCTDSVSGLTSTVVSRNDYLDTIITNIVNYICARFNPATIPSSVVVSGDSYIAVAAATVGYVTTYTVTLDPAGLPTASEVVAGANVVVTGDGTPTTNPYVINANESIVAVDAASALTLVVDPSTPGPYETTYTIGIDNSLLPVTELQTSFGHISITALPNTPNAGDTTYTLEVDEVTISTSDAKLDVVNTAAGGIAPFERTFTVDIDDAEMGNFIMDTAGANIVAAGGITVAYDAIAHQITIGETIGVPDQWKIISDSVLDITAGSPTDKLNIVAGAGMAVALVAGVNEGTFTITNDDLGSAQDIFKNVDCNNGGPSIGIATATTNIDTLTMVGGDDITLGVAGNTITINNDIDHVYSDVIGDDAVSLQAGTTTSTLEVIGGTGISTSGVAGPTNQLTITNDSPNVDQNLWATIEAPDGTSTTANSVTDTLTIAGGNNGTAPFTNGTGVSTSISGDTVTIKAAVDKYDKPVVAAPGAGADVTVTHNLAKDNVMVTVREAGAGGAGYYAGIDYVLVHTNTNELIVRDLGGGLGVGTLSISVMG